MSENTVLLESETLKHSPESRRAFSPDQTSRKLADITEAIEGAGFGLGNARFMLGPFLMMAFEGAEIIIISVVALVLECEWELSVISVFSLQVSAVFGMLLGSFFSSGLSDRYGRRPVLLVSTIVIIIFGLLSAVAPGIKTFLFMRIAIGYFVGSSLGPATAYLVEAIPLRARVAVIAGKAAMWAVGSLVSVLLAMLILPGYGWRALIAACVVVFSPAALFIYLSDESPRFDVANGREEAAAATIARLYKNNNVSLEEQEDIIYDKTGDRSSTSRDYNTTTHDTSTGSLDETGNVWQYITDNGLTRDIILICLYGFTIMAIHYGFSFAAPILLTATDYCTGSMNATDTQPACAHSVSESDLTALAITLSLDPIGPFIAAFFCEAIGRRKTTYGLAFIMILTNSAFYTCTSQNVLVGMLTVTGILKKALGYLPYLVASEYFPTQVRGFAVSMSVFGGRCGAIAGITAAQFGYNLSPVVFPVFVHVMLVLLIVDVTLLKRETRGVQLDTVH